MLWNIRMLFENISSEREREKEILMVNKQICFLTYCTYLTIPPFLHLSFSHSYLFSFLSIKLYSTFLISLYLLHLSVPYSICWSTISVDPIAIDPKLFFTYSFFPFYNNQLFRAILHICILTLYLDRLNSYFHLCIYLDTSI